LQKSEGKRRRSEKERYASSPSLRLIKNSSIIMPSVIFSYKITKTFESKGINVKKLQPPPSPPNPFTIKKKKKKKKKKARLLPHYFRFYSTVWFPTFVFRYVCQQGFVIRSVCV
jgi:hypothetical protein